MSECLITKLKSVVDNDALYKLGELKIKGYDDIVTLIQISTYDETYNISVLNGYLTDKTGSTNLGTEQTIIYGTLYSLYLSPGAILNISNKYKLNDFFISYYNGYGTNGSLNLNDLKYCTNIHILDLNFKNIYGDADELKLLTKLKTIRIYESSNITGSLKSLNDLTSLTKYQIRNSSIRGDLSDVTKHDLVTFDIYGNKIITGDLNYICTDSITEINIALTIITGDISACNNAPNLTIFIANGSKVSGSISSIAANKLLTTIYVSGTSVTGSLESFVESRCSYGLEQTIRINASISMTLNNVALTTVDYYIIVTTSTGATVYDNVNNDTVIATYATSTNTWTYPTA